MKERALFQVSYKVILKNKKGEILGLAYPQSVIDAYGWHGRYDLPGGRIDSDELEMLPLAVIKRELAEELGDVQANISERPVATSIVLPELTFSKKHPIFYVFFEGKYLGGDIVISDEHSGWRWIDLSSEKMQDSFIDAIAHGVKMYLKK